MISLCKIETVLNKTMFNCIFKSLYMITTDQANDQLNFLQSILLEYNSLMYFIDTSVRYKNL